MPYCRPAPRTVPLPRRRSIHPASHRCALRAVTLTSVMLLGSITACSREPEFSVVGSWVDEGTRGRDNFFRYEVGGVAVEATPAVGLYSSSKYTIQPMGDDFLVLTSSERGGKPVVDSAVLRVVDTAHVRMGWPREGQMPDLTKGGIALVRVSDAEGARIEQGARQVALEKLRYQLNGGW